MRPILSGLLFGLFTLARCFGNSYLADLKGIGSSLFPEVRIENHDPVDALAIAYHNFSEFVHFIDRWPAHSWQYVARHAWLHNQTHTAAFHYKVHQLHAAVSPRTELLVNQVQSMHAMAILKSVYFGNACLGLTLSVSPASFAKLLQVYREMSSKYYFEMCIKRLFSQTNCAAFSESYFDSILEDSETPFLTWISGRMFASMRLGLQIKLLCAPRAHHRLQRGLLRHLTDTQARGLIVHRERNRLDSSDYLQCFEMWHNLSFGYDAWEREIRAQNAQSFFPRLLASFKNFSMSPKDVCMALTSDPIHVLTQLRRYNHQYVIDCLAKNLKSVNKPSALLDCLALPGSDKHKVAADTESKNSSKGIMYAGPSKCGVAMCQALMSDEYINFSVFEAVRQTARIVVNQKFGFFTDSVCLSNASLWRDVRQWQPPYFEPKNIASYMSASLFRAMCRPAQQRYLQALHISIDHLHSFEFLFLVPHADWSTLLIPPIDAGMFVSIPSVWEHLDTGGSFLLPMLDRQLLEMPRLKAIILSRLSWYSAKEVKYIKETDLTTYYRLCPYFPTDAWTMALDRWCRSSNLTYRNESQHSAPFLGRDYRASEATRHQHQEHDCTLLAPHQIHPTFLPKGLNDISFANFSFLLGAALAANVHKLSFVRFMADRTWFPYLHESYFQEADDPRHHGLLSMLLPIAFMKLRPVHQVQFLSSRSDATQSIIGGLKGLMVNETEFRAFFARMKEDGMLDELDQVNETTWRRFLAPPSGIIRLASGRQPACRVGQSIRSLVCYDYLAELPKTCEAFQHMFPSLESQTRSSSMASCFVPSSTLASSLVSVLLALVFL